MRVRIKFVPEDFWIGVYVKRETSTFHRHFKVFVCLLPMLPIIFSWSRLLTSQEEEDMWKCIDCGEEKNEQNNLLS